MSFLDLYQGDQQQAATIQPNEGTRLPSGFDENLHAAWSDGLLFSQSIARSNARAAVLGDYIDEIRQKTGNDLSKEFIPDVAGGGQTGVTDFDTANERVAKLKAQYPELDLDPLSDDDIDKRAVAKAQAAHRNYEALQAGEKTFGGSVGSFLGSAGSSAADPVNILALSVAPETAGIGILSSALRWGAVAGVSQAAIEAASDPFKEQVQPGYTESVAPLQEIGGAFLGGAILGGTTKALGNLWSKVKTGQWPTSVRDAGNVIESEANVAGSNPFPGADGEVAHREALVKTIEDILANRPVNIGGIITPELGHEINAGTSAQMELLHGYNKESGFSEFKGLSEVSDLNRYDGGGGVFGKFTYLDPTGKWVAGDQGALGHNAAVKVKGNFEKLFTLTPNSIGRLEAVVGKDAISDGRKISQALIDRGYDAIHVKGFDDFNGDIGSLDSAVMQDQVVSFKPERSLQVGENLNLPNHEDFADKDQYWKERRRISGEAFGTANAKGQFEMPLSPPESETARMTGPELGVSGPQPVLQTTDQMRETINSPDHQEIVRGDIDHAIREGDVMVPGIDENGNHTMVSMKSAIDEVDRYKQAAEEIQACASPIQEAAE